MPRLGDERPVVMVVRDGNKLPLAKVTGLRWCCVTVIC